VKLYFFLILLNYCVLALGSELIGPELIKVEYDRLKSIVDREEREQGVRSEELAALKLKVEDLKRHISSLPDQSVIRAENQKLLQNLENGIAVNQKNDEASRKHMEVYSIPLQRYEKQLKSYEILQNQDNLLNCGPGTYVNLEEGPGSFSKIARDNQDGLGTCFANTAKNLLVSASEGSADASFMDIALNYKKNNSTVQTDILAGGNACQALLETQKQGYCPKNQSVFETGDSNQLFDGIFGKASSTVYSQVSIIFAFKYLLDKNEDLKKSESQSANKMSAQLKDIILKMKSNPNLKFPIPGLSVQIPKDYELNMFFENNLQNKGISKNDFINDFKNNYKAFLPQYIEALVGKKKPESPVMIFEKFKKKMAPFIKKNG